MRIAVITDAHANVGALRAALAAIRAMQPDVIYHLGDAVAIGPYPAETLDLLLNAPDMRFVMGNHDLWFADGLPQPQPDWMSDGEVAHQHWTHAQLDPALRKVVAGWPFVINESLAGVRAVFTHYGLAANGHDFAPFVRDATAQDYDAMFAAYQTDIVFYGHTHRPSDLTGQRRYINPGALGCGSGDEAPFVMLDCPDGTFTLTQHRVAYDRASVLREFDRRNVPERDFIRQAFFGEAG